MPKVVDHDAQRARILASCSALFAARGYGTVTMREIARAAGVSTGSIYHYFPTKKDILAQLFAQMSGTDVVRGAAAVAPHVEPEARIDALLAFVEGQGKHFADLLLLATDVHRHEDVGPLARDALRVYRQAIAEQLGLEPDRAAMLLSTLIGALIHRLLDEAAPGVQEHRPVVLGAAGLATADES